MWNNDYDSLLIEWANFREQLKGLPLYDALLKTQQYWDKAPLCNPYFHITEPETWPSPWHLLADNCFCDLSKTLGKAYTLILSDADFDTMDICEGANNIYLKVADKQHTFILSSEPGEIFNEIPEKIIYQISCDFLVNTLK